MGEEFYCILKLVSGEEVFSLIAVDDSEEENPLIILQNPVVMTIMYSHGNSFVKIKPWMELPNEDIFMIRLDKVITMTECNDSKMINIYNNYISSEDNHSESLPNGRVKLSDEMGYKGSVEQCRKRLEDLFKDIK